MWALNGPSRLMGTERTDAVVVVPWRAQRSRLAAFAHVTGWYQRHGFRVVPVDSGHDTFNLAASRNLGVAIADAPVVVVSDADTFPEPAALDETIRAAAVSGMTHLPYSVGGYRILGGRASRAVLAGAAPESQPFVSFDFSCSGMFVTTPDAWWSHYGHDELFEGWAPEDFAWRITHETLLGTVPRHEGRVYALTHDSASKKYGTEGAGAERYRRYVEAAGDRDRVTALASEWRGHARSGDPDQVRPAHDLAPDRRGP